MRRIAVVIQTADAMRAGEALRAAVGLSLRGDRVDVVQVTPVDPNDERVRRGLATLRALGHAVDAPLSAVREADIVEVWT